MGKHITLTHKETQKQYTLEFSRKTVQAMERSGFVADEIKNKPATMLPALFEGAFQLHHKWADKKVIEEMLYEIKDKDGFLEKLIEMYQEPILAMLDEPDEEQGNIKWEASW